MYHNRVYRDFNEKQRLIPFQVAFKETDLYIKAKLKLENEALESIMRFRKQIEDYIHCNPIFEKSLVPLPFDDAAPSVVKEMLMASSQAGVGPMAAVAGAIAEFVGKSLLDYSSEVIVENGGDIFAFTIKSMVIEIFAGASPLSKKFGAKILPSEMPLGICTSSGTVGPSLSFGKADAVTVLSPSTALADAAATAIGNVVRKEKDISRGLKIAESLPGVKGVIIIIGGKIGAWGGVELIKL